MDKNDQFGSSFPTSSPARVTAASQLSTEPRGLLDVLRPQDLHLSLNGRPFDQNQDDRWSIDGVVYPDYDFFLCLRGFAEFQIGQEGPRLSMGPGVGLLCPPGIPIYARKTGQENFRAIAQHFFLNLAGAGDFFSFVQVDSPVVMPEPDLMIGDYRRFVALFNQPGSSVLRSSVFLSLLFTFVREGFEREVPADRTSFRFVFDVARRLEDALTLPDAVDRALEPVPFSRDYAVRMFRRHFGVPPKEYLLQRRMNAARELLAAGNSVKQTAFSCGFRDELYFSRFFSHREGMSPREYRRTSRS